MVKIVSSYLAEFDHVIGISMRYLSKCNDLIVQNYLIISRLQITQNNALPNNNEKMVHTIFGVIVNEVLPFPMVMDF